MGRRRIFRNGLVVTEVALSVTLLVGAGLMLRSFMALHRVEPGYEADNLLTFVIDLPYPDAEKDPFSRTLEERLLAIPGAAAMTGVYPLPLIESLYSGRYGPEEALTDESLYGQAAHRAVLPGYFETMGTRLLEGRTFTPADHADSAAVVVDDHKLARALWPNGSAVGGRMLVRITTLEPQLVEVVGVVRHERSRSLAADGQETAYLTTSTPVPWGPSTTRSAAAPIRRPWQTPCDPPSPRSTPGSRWPKSARWRIGSPRR